MIILEIALGIVVAFFILAFLPVIFALLGKLITDVFFPIAGILALILLIWGVFKFFDMFFDSPDFRIGTAFVVLVLFVVGIVKSIGNGKIKLAKQDESIAYAEEVTQDWADFLLQELSAELLFYIKNNIIEFFGIKSKDSLRVLTYHDIAPYDYDSFEKQLRWLSRSWKFITPEQFSAMVSGNKKIKGIIRNIEINIETALTTIRDRPKRS